MCPYHGTPRNQIPWTTSPHLLTKINFLKPSTLIPTSRKSRLFITARKTDRHNNESLSWCFQAYGHGVSQNSWSLFVGASDREYIICTIKRNILSMKSKPETLHFQEYSILGSMMGQPRFDPTSLEQNNWIPTHL